jgi:hypothetical protein
MSKRINIVLPDKTVAVLDRVTTKGTAAASLTAQSGGWSRWKARRSCGNGSRRRRSQTPVAIWKLPLNGFR